MLYKKRRPRGKEKKSYLHFTIILPFSAKVEPDKTCIVRFFSSSAFLFLIQLGGVSHFGENAVGT
jgi:hypothetical protein